jgi:hypothetical protein
MIVLNLAIFSFSHGYITSYIFPQKIPDNLKGKSGQCLSLAIVSGVVVGSLIATFVYSKII